MIKIQHFHFSSHSFDNIYLFWILYYRYENFINDCLCRNYIFLGMLYTDVTDITSDIIINIYNHTIWLRLPSYIDTLKHLLIYFKPSLIFEGCLLHSHFVRERLFPLNYIDNWGSTEINPHKALMDQRLISCRNLLIKLGWEKEEEEENGAIYVN